MAVIFRLSVRDEPQHRTCCFCDRPVVAEPVELFVFWPGDEDPMPWFAHPACVARQSSIRKPGTSSAHGRETTG